MGSKHEPGDASYEKKARAGLKTKSFKDRRTETVYGTIFEACRNLPCILAGRAGHRCVGSVTGHHVRSVGAGGQDRENCVPVCVSAHAMCHGQIWGWSASRVESEFGLSLSGSAVAVTGWLDDGGDLEFGGPFGGRDL